MERRTGRSDYPAIRICRARLPDGPDREFEKTNPIGYQSTIPHE